MKYHATIPGIGATCLLALLGAGTAFAQPAARPAKPSPAAAPVPFQKVSSILGTPVRLGDGSALGKIDDLLLNRDGAVAYAVIAYNNRHALVPWGAGSLDPRKRAFVLRVRADVLNQVAFTGDDGPDLADPRFLRRVDAAFGVAAERRTPAAEATAPREQPRSQPEEHAVKASPPSSEAVEVLRPKVRYLVKRYDRDGDGKLSWKEASRLFDDVDKNHDDTLDRKELTAAAVEIATEGKPAPAPRPPTGRSRGKADSPEVAATAAAAERMRGIDQGIIALLRAYDVNKDGMISQDEARAAFKDTDRDHDGQLDEEELLRAAARLLPPAKVTVQERPAPTPGGQSAPPARPATDDNIRTLLLRYDTNHDGRISREEVRGTELEAVFERIDVNKDGYLTREELLQAGDLLPVPGKRPAARPKRPVQRSPSGPADRPTDRPTDRPGEKGPPPAKP